LAVTKLGGGSTDRAGGEERIPSSIWERIPTPAPQKRYF